jgi:hypothetical protein
MWTTSIKYPSFYKITITCLYRPPDCHVQLPHAYIYIQYIIYLFIYRVIKKSLCTWWLQYKKTQCIRTIPTQYMVWRWLSQNIFGMWTVLYRTRFPRTQFGVSINVWGLAGDTLNITCNFLYCNYQVHRDFFYHTVLLEMTIKNPQCT